MIMFSIHNFLFLVLCPLTTLAAVELLKNANVDVNGSSNVTVDDWIPQNTTIYRGSTAYGNCANITDGNGEESQACSELYQVVDTVVGGHYRFSCLGWSEQYQGSGGWGHGLLVTNYIRDDCSAAGNYTEYTSYSWFSYNASASEFQSVALEFEATNESMVVILHSEDIKWACFKGCSLIQLDASPTSSPTASPSVPATSTPTVVPSRLPTSRAPTTPRPTRAPTAPRPPCGNCSVPLCNGLQVIGEQTDCDNIRNLLQVVSWSKALDLANETRTLLCEVIRWENREPCYHHLDENLFQDVCTTVRKNMYPEFLPTFNAKWCINASKNYSDEFSIFFEEPTFLTLSINYTEVMNQAPCLESQKYEVVHSGISNAQYLELGPLADVVTNPHKYPGFPPITKIRTSRTTEVLFNTGCLASTVVAPDWYGVLAAFLVVAIASYSLLFMRRRLQPVKARDPFLLWGSLFWILFNFIWISIDQLTGNRTSCGLISFGNLVAFPMLLFTYLLRALRLLFLYKWSEGKANDQKWFHAHRYLVSRKCFLLALGIFSIFCLTIFVSTNAVDGTFSETFISSGRCDWWDLNQQVVSAAAQLGVALLPTDFNKNGFVPYSVEYSSCVFCSTFDTQVLMCAVTVALLLALVVTIILLRKIKDQFKLWFELVGVLIVLCAVAIVRSVLFFPSAATSMMDTVGSDLSAILLASALLPMLLISALYPALLTFSTRYRVASSSQVSMDGQVAINGKVISISLEEVLKDTFSLNLFKQFAVESFAVENVMYWVHFKEFEDYQLTDPARGEAALKLYETFIRQGSVMEVNIEAPIRERYDSLFGISSTTAYWSGASFASGLTAQEAGSALEATSRNEAETPKIPDELPVDAFQDVTKVVISLMLTNDWLRFKKSPLWDVLQEDMNKRGTDSNSRASEGTQMSAFGSASSTS